MPHTHGKPPPMKKNVGTDTTGPFSKVFTKKGTTRVKADPPKRSWPVKG